MKFQWSIQSSHTQLAWSQVTYLTSRNEHIWPPTKVFTFDWKLFIWLPFFIIFDQNNSIFEKRCHEIFYSSLTNRPLALMPYILNTFLLHLFFLKLVFEVRLFQLFILFRDWCLLSFLHKNKCEEIYRHKSTHVSRLTGLLTNHS